MSRDRVRDACGCWLCDPLARRSRFRERRWAAEHAAALDEAPGCGVDGCAEPRASWGVCRAHLDVSTVDSDEDVVQLLWDFVIDCSVEDYRGNMPDHVRRARELLIVRVDRSDR